MRYLSQSNQRRRSDRRSRHTLLYLFQQHLRPAFHDRLSFPRSLRQHFKITHLLLPIVPQGFLSFCFYTNGVLFPLLFLFSFPLIFLLSLEKVAFPPRFAVNTRKSMHFINIRSFKVIDLELILTHLSFTSSDALFKFDDDSAEFCWFFLRSL